MAITLFSSATEAEKAAAIKRIVEHASPRQSFFLMIMLAIAMATMGVLVDSVVVLIGSMLIAPLLYPLLSLALGVVLADSELMARSFYTLIKAAGFALLAAIIIGVFFPQANLSTIKIISGSVPTLAYAVVAAISGFAAAFAMTKPDLNEMLPGVAIAVALIPPLAVAGVGLAHFDWVVFTNAFLLFLTNVVGIVVSAVVVFSLFNFFSNRHVARQAVAEEKMEVAVERMPAPTPGLAPHQTPRA